MRKDLIKEYKSLPDTWRNRPRRREIEGQLKIFGLGKDLIISGGTIVTISLVQSLFKNQRNKWDKFIEREKAKLKNKNYPAQDWIDTAVLIKNTERRYGRKFYYNEAKDKLLFVSHNGGSTKP